MTNYANPAAEILSRRLRLLMDVMEAERGNEPTFSEIAAFLKERGVNLSRSRWTYMINGHRDIKNQAVFDGLAEFFGVPADFISGANDDKPDKVIAQLDLVRAMRKAEVKSFAARTLGDVSPEALEAITEYLDTHMAK